MLYYLVAFGVLAHVLFWGAGLALLTMPRPWRAYWPILAAPAGFALQSLVVWMAAYGGLPGTQAYAWASELLPAALLAAGLARRGRSVRGDVGRFAGLWLVGAALLAILVRPLATAAKGLTTASLGSCDAADYAAGARVFMEFSHHDRSGFLGLMEVVRVLSVDNFYDFWLRLNHFTPSALIALNGTIFNCAPHELTGLMAAIALTASLPVVFWTARSLLGYGPGASLAIAAAYGFSPVTWYAVYQVSIGQLIAAPGIALVTWAGVKLWRAGAGPARARNFFALLAIGYALILGSYNFIVVVCLVPAAAYAAGLAVWQAQGRRLARWLAGMLLPLGLAGLVFWSRVAGLGERFHQFAVFDFGWRIPALSPEGWFGLVRAPGLEPLGEPGRLILALLAVGLLGAALWSGARRGRRAVYLAFCLIGPILAGYAFLLWRGVRYETNASYDAYKLFAVFYPGLLGAACYWVTLAASQRRWVRGAVWSAALGVALGEWRADRLFGRAMSTPNLIVDRDLIEVGRIERMPQVASLNMHLGYPLMWERLWANELLLRKPQYFLTHTYEGRLNTPLRGQWDLDGGLIAVRLPGGDSVAVNGRYSVERVASPAYFRAELGQGWYAEERLPRSATRWQWTADRATLVLRNPQPHPLRLLGQIDVSSRDVRTLEFWAQGRLVGSAPVSPTRAVQALPELVLPPGETRIELRSDSPAAPAPGDSRTLGFCVFGIQLYAEPDPNPS